MPYNRSPGHRSKPPSQYKAATCCRTHPSAFFSSRSFWPEMRYEANSLQLVEAAPGNREMSLCAMGLIRLKGNLST